MTQQIGGEAEVVLVAARAHTNGTRTYHTEREDCVIVSNWDAERYRRTPKRMLPEHWSECEHCASDKAVETGDTGNNLTTRTCPLCGAQSDNLGKHMRGCTGGESDE